MINDEEANNIYFSSSYDIFAASLLTLMLGVVYYPGVGKMPVSSDTAIKLATSAGTVIGQFGFGTLADIVRPLDPSNFLILTPLAYGLLFRSVVRRCMVWSSSSSSSRRLPRP